MAKKKNTLVYKCNSCGNTQPRWLGRCIECFQWNTYEEFLLSDEAKKIFQMAKIGLFKNQ